MARTVGVVFGLSILFTKPTETFQCTHFSSCHPVGVKKGLIKGEALRLLRTSSSEKLFYENISNFKTRLRARGYSHNLIETITSEVKFTERKSALQQTDKVRKNILPFVTRYHPALPNLKNILMSNPGGGGGYLGQLLLGMCLWPLRTPTPL